LRTAERYLRADGVDEDPYRAYVWLSIATADGHGTSSDASRALRSRLAARLSEADIEAARNEARTLRTEIAAAAAAAAEQAVDLPLPEPPGRAPGQRLTRGGGTGFVVDGESHVLTSYHVVQHCRSIRAGPGGIGEPAALVAYDEAMDLALLKLPGSPPEAAWFSAAPLRLAESIVVFGFALPGVLASSGSVGVGIVSALAGPRDDAAYFQISAPYQPGTSGAPVFNQYGRVTGVVGRRPDAVGLVERDGGMPQTIAFAIRLDEVRRFLDRHEIAYRVGERKLPGRRAQARPQQPGHRRGGAEVYPKSSVSSVTRPGVDPGTVGEASVATTLNPVAPARRYWPRPQTRRRYGRR
jgi:S1-C subfamily serine protease